MGSICASSKIITLWARLCSLRHWEERLAKRDSKNCTAVDTTTGISQFSVALASLAFSGLASSSMSYSTPEWCSSTFSSPRIFRKTWAFCSMMEVYGTT